MAVADQINTELDITRVVAEVAAVLRRNFVTFAILAVLLTGVPTAVLLGVAGDTLEGRWSGFGPDFWPHAYWATLSGMVAVVTTLVLQAAIIAGTVSDMNGQPVSVFEALRTGLRSFLPLLGLSIVFGVCVGFACLLLVVPGIMLAIAWCVAVPAFVVEQTGVFGSFGRSADLTRGNRWQIFALVLLFAVISIIVQVVLGVFGGIASFATIGHFPILTRVVIFPLIAVVKSLLGATGAAVLYVELRRIRDGVEPKGLAALFA